jgi:putative DNA primase/helicase
MIDDQPMGPYAPNLPPVDHPELERIGLIDRQIKNDLPRTNGRQVPDDRPIVRVELGKLPASVARSNQLLARHSASMFVLGNILVTVENAGAGLQTIPASQDRIGLELARVARYEKIARMTDAGPEWRECDPPGKLSAAIAAEPGGWRCPILDGLTEVPILRPDGRVVTRTGYDPASRLYLHGGPFAPVGRDPRGALAVLLDALREFPFVEPHHRSAALALLLTAVIRRQLPAAPMFGISAREAGTGKGALAGIAAILATGRRAPENPWPVTADEQRKAITAALLDGSPMLILDNITGHLESTPLCVLLTAERWSDRMLGQSRMVQLPASTLVVATGNNLTVVGDLVRRVMPIEMDARCESPELRRFDRELIPWAIENRAKLVAAALTILAEHRRAGEPVPTGFVPLGSFEVWSRTVCGALVALGQPDPREAMAANRAADPNRLILARVLTGVAELFGKRWQTAGAIFDAARMADRLPEFREAIEELTARAPNDRAAKIALGKWLTEQKGRVVGGLRLDAQRDDHSKVWLWRVEPCG